MYLVSLTYIVRYHSLAPMYYRGAQAAIVVYDITNQVWDSLYNVMNVLTIVVYGITNQVWDSLYNVMNVLTIVVYGITNQVWDSLYNVMNVLW